MRVNGFVVYVQCLMVVDVVQVILIVLQVVVCIVGVLYSPGICTVSKLFHNCQPFYSAKVLSIEVLILC